MTCPIGMPVCTAWLAGVVTMHPCCMQQQLAVTHAACFDCSNAQDSITGLASAVALLMQKSLVHLLMNSLIKHG